MAGLALGERAGHRPGGPALWRLAGLVGLGGCLLVWLVLLGPLGALLAHLRPSVVGRALSAPGALGPLVTSLEASALALALLVVLGTPLAWAMARDRLPAPRIIEAGVLVPLLMPPLVIGLLLVFLAGPATPVGRALGLVHLSASDTFFALVLAELYEAGPYYVLGVAAAVRSVDPELEAQAALLGDPWPRVARRVTLPLAAPGVASTLAVAWARAIGAFGAVIIVAYHPYGLPMQIWVTLEEQGLPAALPFALVLLVVALPLPLLGLLWAARTQRAAQVEPLEVPG
ncbi:ABC transporter permease subunit [Aciditerrimonas ferrireducens]|uniref:ABC transporter permease subunit n=1 Tax=Aciditerrimonas ferrireducens TaxID=667306 RepID=UPI002005C697|nr:ABC transporter permease subunit [Aciditerrimonas ferrireducens]MCK4175991.1 ABC transporter permease subunit [Aciditerrimonas ferrireducens]